MPLMVTAVKSTVSARLSVICHEVSGQLGGRANKVIKQQRRMSRVVALRVISRARNNQVAFRPKQTSNGG